ncbi:MAG: hypothetical protein SRB2_01715 [Desulfobacteraceae bacterium Eth-SRB2]|nr:MAG: hypothetical protein SRB2_01715 [Desulfobacteraceae bacterium Eth-SRB2]
MGRVMEPNPDIRIRRIEICHLELRYAHIRVHNPEAALRLAASLQQYSQIIPVLIVPAEHPKYILIDGYLRVAAAKRCGKDTLLAQIWCMARNKRRLFTFWPKPVSANGMCLKKPV